MFYGQRDLFQALHRPLRLLLLGAIALLFILGCQLPSEISPAASPSAGSDLSAPAESPQAQFLPIGAQVRLGDRIIQLEVAATEAQQAQGLMYRTELPDDRGMIFPFTPPRRAGFWMKNTLIPLDIIFLRNQKIITLHEQVPPCQSVTCPTYSAQGLTDEVIELRAGLAQELGLKLGDRVAVEYLSPEAS
ncbi:DUF192 domain-containing protein [Lyngbya confervoides]|uniref:DUF192 domain-containing protein n=1 Tax=Lyngbya confervoides BDU141951 TaxID=1574623 RepID=A0ABD4T9V4_9CYAN|nr:DUF192 domain-containing protein [Lyngbya confervoides]MCM1985189.1 DUF192 domain-containing protein [Lyngbya confervoides BDU141951]